MTAAVLKGEDRRRRPPEPIHRRTLQPVRRNSLVAGGEWEQAWRNRLNRAEARDLVRAAKLFDENGRKRLRADKSTRRRGPLGDVAIRLLELICNTAQRHKGWVYWTVEELAKKIGHGASAVHEAKARLQAHGFLDWARRFVEVDGDGHQRGPQVEQTSNLYRLSLPEAARKLLGIFGRKAPPPADDEARRREMLGRIEAQLKQEFADRLDASPSIRRAVDKAAREGERERGSAEPRQTGGLILSR